MELRPGYKQTEVGAIPEDWETHPLGVGVRLLSGQHVLARHCNTDGDGAPYITGPADFPEGVIQHTRFTTEPGTLCRSNDILVTVKGSGAGTVVLSNADYCISRQLMAIRVTEWNTGYIYFSLLRDASLFGAAATGLIPGLSRNDILNKVIPLPPTKAEQQAIAEALSDADALIDSLEQLIAKKRHLKQGAMQELLRPKDQWAKKTLGELAKIQRGASPRPIDSPMWFDENSAVGWVRISDVTRAGMFLRETTQRLSPLGIQNSRPVNRGSLIMSICATVGRPIITEIDTCIHDGFVVFDSLRANKYFLYYVLKSIEGDWARHGQTGSQMNLNTGLINRTEVAAPKTEREQEEIAEVFVAMDAEIAALEAKLAKARQIKQGMMHNLLTGRIRLV